MSLDFMTVQQSKTVIGYEEYSAQTSNFNIYS